MSLVKICPSCGCKNNSGDSICDDCMADISGIIPVDENVINQEVSKAVEPVNDASATVIERKKILRFVASDESGSFSVNDNAVIGREAEGREYLASHMTVSRRHARLSYNGSWNIEDLNSANGTFVNEHRLENGEQTQIKSGNRVSLSHSCTFNIIE